MIKVISFDIGGTLVKNRYDYSAKKAIMKASKVTPSIFENAYRKHFIKGEGSLKDFCNQICCKDMQYVKKLAKQYYLDKPLGVLYPDVLPTLNTLLQRGYLLITISNKSYMNTSSLKEYGINSYFQAEINSYDVGYAKPEKEIFYYVQKKMRIEANEIIHVGNSIKSDVEGANGVGWETVLINREKDSSEIIPSYVINDLRQLLEII